MKVSYANMKLKVKDEVKTFKFQDNDIEMLQYLPSEDKYSLINIPLRICRKFDPYALKISSYAPPILRRFKYVRGCFYIY